MSVPAYGQPVVAGEPVVVIGTGHAGFHVAQSLRDNGFTDAIVLIGEEPHLPYERPPLSKAFLKGDSPVAFRPASFYLDRQIQLVVGRVQAIDRKQREVRLTDGTRLRFAHLVLATGSNARPLPIPGADLHGVLALRTLSDAGSLRTHLASAGRVVVVGGGFIGLEATSAALAGGAAVEVVEAAPRLMGRAVSEPISEHLRRQHLSSGVSVRLNAKVTRIVGAGGRVTGVELESREFLPADLVLVGVGSIPRCDLAESAGLPVDNGILVDEHLMTSDPGISAIGDCARFPVTGLMGTRLVRLESVQNAVDQARNVAARLTGSQHPYSAVPWFWSEQAGLRLQMAGLPGSHDLEVLRPGRTADRFSVMLFAGDRLVGAESVNSPADHVSVRRLLASGRNVTPLQMADPAFDLRTLAS